MKYEVMREEFDQIDYIKFSYWDGGYKGLLAGESLYLDLKRLEMGYHEHTSREYEMTKHVSIRRIDPLLLLKIKATGACEIKLPEWIYNTATLGPHMTRN